MTRLKDVEAALDLLVVSASMHAEMTESGDFKKGNKLHKSILEAIDFLKAHSALPRLEALLQHQSVGVRCWSATYLLKINEPIALDALRRISNSGGIQSFIASTTISEWEKGNLKL